MSMVLRSGIKNNKSTLFLFFILIAFRTSGQNYNIKNYTINDGLPHNNVRGMTFDSTGFLWLATWDGLSRFDGYEFRNYYHILNDTTSLPYFSIYRLVADRNNTLWLLTDKRDLVRYNREKDNFTKVRNIAGFSTDIVSNILTDTKGNLIVLTRNKVIINRLDSRSYEVHELKNKDGTDYTAGFDFSSVAVTKNEIWISMLTTVRKFLKKEDGIYVLEEEYPLIKSPQITRVDFELQEWNWIYISPSGRKWILSNTGLYSFDPVSKEFREFREEILPGEFTGYRYFIWSRRAGDIYIYDSFNKSTTIIPGERSKLTASVLPGSDNSIWLSGTSIRGVPLGVSHLVRTPGYFKNHLFTDRDSIPPAVYAVAVDKFKRVWTAIRGEDHIFLTDTNNVTTTFGKLSEKMASESAHIRSFLMNPDGVWVGYYRSLLRYYDYNTGRFTDYYPEKVNGGFRAISNDGTGKIIVGSDNLFSFDPVTGKTDILWKTSINASFFKVHLQDDSLLYASGSLSFLLKYNLRTNTSKLTHMPGGQSNGEDVIQGDNGELWVALLGDGVCRYDPEAENFTYYTTSNGLSNNTTYHLLKDRSGKIWVTTNVGISRIDPSTGRIRIFGKNDGLQIVEFNSGAKFETEDGEFLFGGMGGYVRFHPDSIAEAGTSDKKQRILLTGLEVSGEVKRLRKPINISDTIFLNKGENNFHLTFSSTDFINSEKTQYRYKLSEVDKEWIETGPGNRNINYSNLRPAWYVLNIEATDLNGDWAASKELRIRVRPLFHQTWLFIILVPLLILSLIVLSVVTYINNLKQKEIQIQNQLKLRSLRGQMNPHFIFNSLNSINYFISNNDRLSANRYIADFSRLIRSILSNMGADYVPLEKDINSIEDYLRIEHLRFGDKFDYEIVVDQMIDKQGTEVSPGIAQPFIENAIWHGVRALTNRKGFIRVSFEVNDEISIRCIIEDDGIGRQASLSGKQNNSVTHYSKGIGIVSERLQITGKINRAHYSLEISDLHQGKNEPGTRVVVDIPIKREWL